MKKYRVIIFAEGNDVFEIEAENEEEAKKQAIDEFHQTTDLNFNIQVSEEK